MREGKDPALKAVDDRHSEKERRVKYHTGSQEL